MFVPLLGFDLQLTNQKWHLFSTKELSFKEEGKVPLKGKKKKKPKRQMTEELNNRKTAQNYLSVMPQSASCVTSEFN